LLQSFVSRETNILHYHDNDDLFDEWKCFVKLSRKSSAVGNFQNFSAQILAFFMNFHKVSFFINIFSNTIQLMLMRIPLLIKFIIEILSCYWYKLRIRFFSEPFPNRYHEDNPFFIVILPIPCNKPAITWSSEISQMHNSSRYRNWELSSELFLNMLLDFTRETQIKFNKKMLSCDIWRQADFHAVAVISIVTEKRWVGRHLNEQ
jgi:hypothetical protein